MKRLSIILSVLLAVSLICISVTEIRVSANIFGDEVEDSGMDYTEVTENIQNPMRGSAHIATMTLKEDKSVIRSDSDFMHYFIEMKYFSGGYKIKDGVKMKLSDEETELRTDPSKAQDWKSWAGSNQRNHGGAKDIPLSDAAIEGLRQTFSNLRNNGGTCIIRPSYATNAENYNEPYDFDILMTHVKQLCEVITEFSDVVGGIELGTIGPFGEMWGSSPYSHSEYANQIIKGYLDWTPDWVAVMVRTTNYISNFFGGMNMKKYIEYLPMTSDKDGIKASYTRRLGLFNDGYMLTSSDTGTWSSCPRSLGVEWLNIAGLTTYYGGEYGSGTRSEDFWLPKNALPEMYKTHTAYINGNVYSSTMSSVNVWKINLTQKNEEEYINNIKSQLVFYDFDKNAVREESSNGKLITYTFNNIGYDSFEVTEELAKMSTKADVRAFYGKNVRDFIWANMGYRLVLRQSRLTKSVKQGGLLQLTGIIENTGFGNIVMKNIAQIVIAKEGKEVAAITTEIDPNSFQTQEKSRYSTEIKLSKELEPGEYDIYMRVCSLDNMKNPSTKCAIRFSNQKKYYSADLHANYLGTMTVTDEADELAEDGYREVRTVFDDVVTNEWYEKYVVSICKRGLMSGMTTKTFEPGTTTSRAMLVKVLYNLEGQPSVSKMTIPFTDIPTGQWYTDAVIWAYNNDITSGTTSTTFSPSSTLTREQFAALMMRYASKIKNMDTSSDETLGSFTDRDEISEYAVSPMKWAVSTGLITGMTETTLGPKGNATRAQMATILDRFLKLAEK